MGWLSRGVGGWATRAVESEGVTIAVRERGAPTSPCVVLLHGLGAHQRIWDRVAKELGDFRLVTFDYRGHGRSGPANSYSVRSLLRDLDTVVESIRIEDFVLVGHSIGADLALCKAIDPGGCHGIVLVDGALTIAPPPTDRERYSVMENSLIFKALLSVGRAFGAAPSMTIAEIRSLTEDLELQREKQAQLLEDLKVPAMYVIGNKADKVPDGELIHERKMGAISEVSSRFDVRVEYVECGHFVPMQQPRRLGQLIREFCLSTFA